MPTTDYGHVEGLEGQCLSLVEDRHGCVMLEIICRADRSPG